jgi:GAF domain-containing protein
MYIALYEPDRNLIHFELAYLDGKPEDIEHDERWMPRSGGKGRTEWIIHNKKPILTYTKTDAEKWYQQPDTKDYIGQKFASWLGVPIQFGNEVMGVIATYHKTDEYKYGPDDQTILALMGRQAAIALMNARLIRQLDKRIHELDTIRELGEDLSQNTISLL